VDPVDPVDPAIPTDPPTWSTADFWLGEDLHWYYVVPVSGAPGTVVQALLGGQEGDSVVLGEDGTGIVQLRASLDQFLFASLVPVTFRYVLPSGEAGPSATTSLYALEPQGAGADERAAAAAAEEQPAVVIEEAEQAPAPEAPVAETVAPVAEVAAPTDAASAEPAPAESAPTDAAPAEVVATDAPTADAAATEAPAEDAPPAE
jgi:hypothetical protein